MGKIYLEGADNTRDLGGLKTTEGAVIKDKQLIRSNRLSRITQKDKILLETEYHLQIWKWRELFMRIFRFFWKAWWESAGSRKQENRCYIWKNFQRCQIFIR